MCDISQLRGYPLDNRSELVRQEVGKDGRSALVLGKGGKISKEDKKRGLELALIARKLMLAEEGRSDD